MSKNKEEPYFEVQIKLKPKSKDKQNPFLIPEDQLDEFGNYTEKFPLQNFNDQGRKDLLNLPVTYKTFQNNIETAFSRQISHYRHLYNAGLVVTTASVLSTGYFLRQKHKYIDYMFLISGSLLFGCLYLRDLAYGDAINRVNVEAFKIMTEERKLYFQKEFDVSKGLKSLKEKME
eukprot:gene9528-1734_t